MTNNTSGKQEALLKPDPKNTRHTSSLWNDFLSLATSLQVPKSPRTPTVVRGMGHQIAHRFTKTFKMMSTCGYCQKPIYFGSGLKCKECKYKCHRECENKVTPSCGLPPELLDEFKKKWPMEGRIKSFFNFFFCVVFEVNLFVFMFGKCGLKFWCFFLKFYGSF